MFKFVINFKFVFIITTIINRALIAKVSKKLPEIISRVVIIITVRNLELTAI